MSKLCCLFLYWDYEELGHAARTLQSFNGLLSADSLRPQFELRPGTQDFQRIAGIGKPLPMYES